MITLLLISILPILVVGYYINMKDKNKESKKFLAFLFLLGIFSAVISFILTLFLSYSFPFFEQETNMLNYFEIFIYVFIGIALIEELSKWLVTYNFCYNNKHFDEIYDMIVYSVFIALGFATFENVIYVVNGGIQVGLIRSITAIPAHMCFGVYMGYYLTTAKLFETRNSKKMLKHKLKSLLVPTLIHGIYDFCLYSQSIILIFTLVIIMIYILIGSLKKINQLSKINYKFKKN